MILVPREPRSKDRTSIFFRIKTGPYNQGCGYQNPLIIPGAWEKLAKP